VISYKWDPGNYQDCRFFCEALGKIQIWEIMSLAYGLVGHDGGSLSLDKIGYDFISWGIFSLHDVNSCYEGVSVYWFPLLASLNPMKVKFPQDSQPTLIQEACNFPFHFIKFSLDTKVTHIPAVDFWHVICPRSDTTTLL
jgi:hypothetical protein